jgi:hypothetical protein
VYIPECHITFIIFFSAMIIPGTLWDRTTNSAMTDKGKGHSKKLHIQYNYTMFIEAIFQNQTK